MSTPIDRATDRTEPTFESLTTDLEAITPAVPDMDRDDLIDLREALNMVTEAIEKELGERDWVTRNEH
jgi:hypothetical protein